jgi:hypothetical protein
MEYVEGTTLAGWLGEPAAPTRRDPPADPPQQPVVRRPWHEVLDRYLLAGRGLLAAHDAGLVHRDFKPGNVLVGNDGRVCVTDFGLVRDAGEHETAPAPADVPVGDHDVATRTGTLLGSPGYMAPEQMAGESVDARSDVFSFCVSLWRGLFGEPPFPGRTIGELRGAVAAGLVREPPAEAEVPAWLREVVRRGLHRDPSHRPGLRELLAELQRERTLQELSRVERALHEAQQLAQREGDDSAFSRVALALLQDFVSSPAGDPALAELSLDVEESHAMEVLGAHLRASLEVLGGQRTLASHFLAREGVGTLGPDGLVDLDPARWYPSTPVVRAVHRFAARVGPRAAFDLGFASQAAVGDKGPAPDLRTGLLGSAALYRKVFRAPGGGPTPVELRYEVEDAGDRALRVTRGGRWPCDFDRGLLTGLALRLDPSAVVGHLGSDPCRKDGAPACKYLVTWGAPAESQRAREEHGVTRLRLSPAGSVDAFLFDPFGRYVKGDGLLYFCADPQLDGTLLWGSPSIGDVELLSRAGGALHRRDAAPRVSLLDLRRVRDIPPETYQAMSGYIRRIKRSLKKRLRAQALVRPQGMPGAVIAGYFEIEPLEHPFRIFTDPAEALAWLGRSEPGLLEWLDELPFGKPVQAPS